MFGQKVESRSLLPLFLTCMPVLEGMSISKSISPTSSTVTVNEEASDLATIV